MHIEEQTAAEWLGPTYLETRVGAAHPFRKIREILDNALKPLDARFQSLYPDESRDLPKSVLRSMFLQSMYGISSDRLFMDWLERDLPSRWFVGVNIDDILFSQQVYSRHRELLTDAGIATPFLKKMAGRKKAAPLPD